MKNIKLFMLIKKYQRLLDQETNELKQNLYRSILDDLLDLLT